MSLRVLPAVCLFVVLSGAAPPQQSPAPQHPLVPALQQVQAAQQRLAKVRGYTTTLVKREEVDGKLHGPDFVQLKIRHQPFSVYTRYLKPEDIAGQEAIYVSGQNNGKLLAHGVGLEKVLGTFSLDPTGTLAMEGQRFPITDAGLANLLAKLARRFRQEMQYGECDVQFYQGAKVDGRSCRMFEVRHPQPRRNFRYALARLYIDDQLGIPLRFEGYSWPARSGQPLRLVEEYTYTRLRLNPGLTDRDFSVENPQYDY